MSEPARLRVARDSDGFEFRRRVRFYAGVHDKSLKHLRALGGDAKLAVEIAYLVEEGLEYRELRRRAAFAFPRHEDRQVSQASRDLSRTDNDLEALELLEREEDVTAFLGRPNER